jgi:GDPmannose 4,6-dehydratase
LLDVAFDQVGLDWHDYVRDDPRFYRPSEVNVLLGDPTRAREVLGWEPETSFEQLVRLMVDADQEVARRERRGASNGV